MTVPTLHFCTYFDRNYLARALVLYRSLVSTGVDFRIWALCLDVESQRVLEHARLSALNVIGLDELESFDADLRDVKPTRSRVEYYFTLTPVLPLYVMWKEPDATIVSYLDADLRFYSSPVAVIDRLGDGSTLIIPHAYPERLSHLSKFGTFNVGMVTFRNDDRGRGTLTRWRAQCLDWCYDRAEDGRYADQAYLNDWPTALDGVVVVDVPGIGLGPWNAMRFSIDISGPVPRVDGHPLVFYHFHGFKEIGRHLYYDGLLEYGGMPRPVRNVLYGGYVRDLRSAAGSLVDGRLAGSGRSARGFSARTIVGLARRGHVLFEFGDHILG